MINFDKKLQKIADDVAQMRAKGIPDEEIADTIRRRMARNERGIPAIAIGAGLSSAAFPDESNRLNALDY